MKKFTNWLLELIYLMVVSGFGLPFTATSQEATNSVGEVITADPKLATADSDLFNEFEPHFWDNRDGLPFNRVSAIHVDKKGYLWLGSYFGITRFNGEEFVKFDPYNTPNLRSDTFTAIVGANNSSFWASTYKGLYLSDGKEFSEVALDDIPTEAIQWMTRTDDGVLWMATNDGLVKLDGDTTTNYGKEELGLSEAYFQSIRPFGPDQLLVFGPAGNYLFDTLQERFMELPWGLDEIQLQTSQGPVLGYDSEGYVWYQSVAEGTLRFQAEDVPDARATNAISMVSASDTRFSGHILLALDENEDVWIAHQNGQLSRHQDGTEKSIDLHSRYRVTQIDTFLQDGENYWLGSQEGLVLLKKRSVNNVSIMSGLPDHHVSSIAQFPDGRFLIGTAYEPAIFDRETGEMTVIHLNLDDRNIRSICIEPGGGFWIGNEHHGPLLIDKDNKVHYSPAHSIWHDSETGTSARVSAMIYDSTGSFWVGYARGAVRIFPDDSFVQYNRSSNPELPVRDVRVIYEHIDNSIWMGSEGQGLAILQTSGEFKHITMTNGLSGNEVFALTQERTGDANTVWAATDNGITRIRDNGATIDSIGPDRNLPAGTINQILIDDVNDMWITSLQGIHRIPIEDMNKALDEDTDLKPVMTVDWSDGMLNAETNGENQPAGIIDRNGEIWIPTIKGATYFNPAQYRPLSPPLPPIIERISLDNDPIFDNSKPKFNESIFSTGRTLEPDEGDRLEFELAAPSIRLTEAATYQVKLGGDADDEWENTKAPRVIYTTLKPGKYAFQSRVASSKGKWSPASAPFRFERKQYFYRTWSFYGIAILTAICGGLLLHYRRMRIAAKILHLEQNAALIAERERIARDMHDDLGSRLTHISLIAEISERERKPPTQEQLSELNSAARQAARAMEEIVWTAKPENDTWDNTLSYLIQHAEHQLTTADIACRNDFALDWSDKYLAPDIRSSVLLTFKESINNIIKHSQAKEVWVSVFPTENVVTIRIKDNGRGFDPKNLSEGEHNGLRNMASRMADVGGTFSIRSKTGKGTIVEIVFTALGESDTHYSRK